MVTALLPLEDGTYLSFYSGIRQSAGGWGNSLSETGQHNAGANDRCTLYTGFLCAGGGCSVHPPPARTVSYSH